MKYIAAIFRKVIINSESFSPLYPENLSQIIHLFIHSTDMIGVLLCAKKFSSPHEYTINKPDMSLSFHRAYSLMRGDKQINDVTSTHDNFYKENKTGCHHEK